MVPDPLTPAHPVAPAAAPLSPAQMSSSGCPGGTAAVAGTSPATTTSKRRKTNAENSATLEAKRQKRGGAEMVSNENSQPVEGGRGKRQRFQSSRVAAANAIGTN